MSPLGGSPSYPVTYNGYQLKGYVQEESDSSAMNIVTHNAAYFDGGISEYTGLVNKSIPIKLRLWEEDWETCKNQYLLSTTYLRSKRDGWAKLYINSTDKYYYAMTRSVSNAKAVGSSMKILDYDVEWEAKPFLERTIPLTISGTGTGGITTAILNRTIENNGGWTPAVVTITGSNVTVSGYSDSGDFTGYISVAGSVTNLIIDSEAYTAKISGANANDKMAFIDYQMWLAPGTTNYQIGGSPTLVKITWHDRWY